METIFARMTSCAEKRNNGTGIKRCRDLNLQTVGVHSSIHRHLAVHNKYFLTNRYKIPSVRDMVTRKTRYTKWNN